MKLYPKWPSGKENTVKIQNTFACRRSTAVTKRVTVPDSFFLYVSFKLPIINSTTELNNRRWD